MDTVQKHQQLSLQNACVNFMFAYQQKNVERMLSFCDPQGEVHFLPLGESGKGRIGELGRQIWSSLIDSFPDLDNTLDAAVAEEGNVVRCQVVIRGTQEKDFTDIPTQGKPFDSDHIFIFHFNDDNRIDRIHISWNHDDFRRQLGA